MPATLLDTTPYAMGDVVRIGAEEPILQGMTARVLDATLIGSTLLLWLSTAAGHAYQVRPEHVALLAAPAPETRHA
jgi:hypothetical protein